MSTLSISSILPTKRNISPLLNKTYVGIDFGTSTTVVSIASYDNEKKMIKTQSLRLKQLLEDKTIYSSEIIPSVIAWYHNSILIGEGASNLKYNLKRGKNVWYSFKMELGEDLGVKYFESELRDNVSFGIRNPKDAARVFFAYLKHLIVDYCKESGLSEDISYAVSIPASFEANQRRDLLDALLANDMQLSKQSLIDEPNAAFISYAVTRASEDTPLFLQPNYNSKVLVFDFGGGTCDISILEIGQNQNGFFSKNVAISKFTELGGDDIDRYITYRYIMPRFLEANGLKMENFRTKEKEYIASALFKIAERLKIMINKSLSTLTTNLQLPEVKNSDIKTTIETRIDLETAKGVLSENTFYLTNRELTDTMNLFLKTGTSKTTRIKGENDYISVFSPIEDAIKKANVDKSEIDYVLLIGGSSQSPYLQEALNDYFNDSELLIPNNLRTHVSKGAAIHSLLYNGMNKCLIQPITSEPILIVTKDYEPKIILPAGTQIPCKTIKVDDLVTSKEGQTVVELPICVGSVRKQLFNLKIESPNPSGFPIHTPIQIVFEVNSDKMLLVKANCMDVSCDVEPMSPFSNKELTTEERIALKAERQANIEAEKNGGEFTKSSLNALKQAYLEAGQKFKAAETYELLNELYPSSDVYNAIGVYYGNAGAPEKAIEFYKKALEENPDHPYANANLGSTLRGRDKVQAKRYLQKALELNPNNDIALIELGRIQKSEGDLSGATEKFQRAYDILLPKWNNNALHNYAYGWLESVAQELGEADVAREVRMSDPNNKEQKYYNTDNLSITNDSNSIDTK